MILLVIVASILIAAITIIQFNKQSKEYHEQRLERKENHLILNLNYFLSESKAERLDSIPQNKINEITDIHEIPFELYSLQGNLLKSSISESKNNLRFRLESMPSDQAITRILGMVSVLADDLAKSQIGSIISKGATFKEQSTFSDTTHFDFYIPLLGYLILQLVPMSDWMESYRF